MLNKKLTIFIYLLFLPSFLFAERPYFGVEEGFFFPRGDWGNKIGVTPSLKFSIYQKIIKNFSVDVTVGSVSFSSEHPKGFELSMSPLVYLDAIAETNLKTSLPLGVGLLLGIVYSDQKITYGDGSEEATIWGWNTGALISFHYKFMRRLFLKARYISRKSTNGLEFSSGINF